MILQKFVNILGGINPELWGLENAPSTAPTHCLWFILFLVDTVYVCVNSAPQPCSIRNFEKQKQIEKEFQLNRFQGQMEKFQSYIDGYWGGQDSHKNRDTFAYMNKDKLTIGVNLL